MQSSLDVGSIGWRIPYIPHAAPGGRAYHRAYGWGYLSWPGIALVVAGTADLMLGPDTPWKLALILGGLLLTFTGVALNGLSERRRMRRVHAQCLDVEIRDLLGTTRQTSGSAVRAHMRYALDGRTYDATPGPLGYLRLGRRETAEAFAAHLRNAAFVALDVDPQHPTRALFVEHGVPKPAHR